jgi:hypothetical protein
MTEKVIGRIMTKKCNNGWPQIRCEKLSVILIKTMPRHT